MPTLPQGTLKGCGCAASIASARASTALPSCPQPQRHRKSPTVVNAAPAALLALQPATRPSRSGPVSLEPWQPGDNDPGQDFFLLPDGMVTPPPQGISSDGHGAEIESLSLELSRLMAEVEQVGSHALNARLAVQPHTALTPAVHPTSTLMSCPSPSSHALAPASWHLHSTSHHQIPINASNRLVAPALRAHHQLVPPSSPLPSLLPSIPLPCPNPKPAQELDPYLDSLAPSPSPLLSSPPQPPSPPQHPLSPASTSTTPSHLPPHLHPQSPHPAPSSTSSSTSFPGLPPELELSAASPRLPSASGPPGSSASTSAPSSLSSSSSSSSSRLGTGSGTGLGLRLTSAQPPAGLSLLLPTPSHSSNSSSSSGKGSAAGRSAAGDAGPAGGGVGLGLGLEAGSGRRVAQRRRQNWRRTAVAATEAADAAAAAEPKYKTSGRDSMAMLLGTFSKDRMLTAEEEQRLAAAAQDFMQLRELRNVLQRLLRRQPTLGEMAETLRCEEETLSARLEAGNHARSVLAQKNYRLVVALARRAARGLPSYLQNNSG
ncbi:hypothetical protein Agub_g1426, partial [Astrephomene gubernaculifera]